LIIRYPLFDIAACAFSAKTYLPKSFGLHHCPMRKEKNQNEKEKKKVRNQMRFQLYRSIVRSLPRLKKRAQKIQGVFSPSTRHTFEFSDGHDDDRGDGLPDACASVQAQV
jgi:hypothetical protein